jgi:hypothetical protein
MHTLDHANPESEVQAEQAQVKDFTNLVLIKVRPGAFHQLSMTFALITALC